MTQSFIRWMRVVLPNSTSVTLCIACDMSLEIIYLIILWMGWQADEEFFRRMHLAVLGMSAFSYGASRIFLFHPLLNEQYFAWLQTTPWTAEKPLPAGPIQQIPQDLIVVAALMLLTRTTSVQVLALPVVFLLGYLSVLTVATRACGDWAFAYLLAAGLGAVFLAIRSLPAACIVALACYPIAFVAIRRSLKRFPWEFDWKNITKYTQQNFEQIFKDRHGWPYDFMSPKVPKRWIPYSDGICLSLLAGWIAFVILFHVEIQERPIVCGIGCQILSILVLVRAGSYMTAHRWPINLWGRLWTLRWIIPRFDIIFVAPLLAEVILFATQIVAVRMNIMNNPRWNPAPNPVIDWLALACSAAGIAASMMVLLIMGPVLERWRLAGAHRIVFDQGGMASKSSQSQFIEL